MRSEYTQKYFETRLPPDQRRSVLWRALWTLYFRHLVNEDYTVLDLGAGYCEFINSVHARRRLALDRWPGVRLHAAAGVEARVGELDDLDWLEDSAVDFAFASNVFEHLEQQQFALVLACLRRKLSPRGRLCIVQPNYRYCYRAYFDDYTHKSVYTHVSLCDFLSAHHFEVLECRPRFLPTTLKSRLPVHLLLVWLYLRSPIKPMAGQMLVVARPAART